MAKIAVLFLLATLSLAFARPETEVTGFPDNVDFDWEDNLQVKGEAAKEEVEEDEDDLYDIIQALPEDWEEHLAAKLEDIDTTMNYAMKALYNVVINPIISPMTEMGRIDPMAQITSMAESVTGVATQARNLVALMTGPVLTFGILFAIGYVIYYALSMVLNFKYSLFEVRRIYLQLGSSAIYVS